MTELGDTDNQGANGWRFDVADDGNFPHSWWVDYRSQQQEA